MIRMNSETLKAVVKCMLGVKTISKLDCALNELIEALNFKNLQRRARVLGRPFESWQLSKQVPTGRRIPPAWTCQPWNFTFSGIMEVSWSDNLKIYVFSPPWYNVSHDLLIVTIQPINLFWAQFREPRAWDFTKLILVQPAWLIWARRGPT